MQANTESHCGSDSQPAPFLLLQFSAIGVSAIHGGAEIHILEQLFLRSHIKRNEQDDALLTNP